PPNAIASPDGIDAILPLRPWRNVQQMNGVSIRLARLEMKHLGDPNRIEQLTVAELTDFLPGVIEHPKIQILQGVMIPGNADHLGGRVRDLDHSTTGPPRVTRSVLGKSADDRGLEGFEAIT